jgi:Protein kinase domain
MSLGTPLRPGDPVRVAGYRVTARLGSGGQGTVFLGQAPDGAAVAVKLLHARLDNTPEARVRFAREIGAARRVASFCTARILAADVEGETPYLVSEFIAGPTLSQAVRERGPLTGDDLHRLAVGTANALVAIHAAGVVHRDLKPANILLGEQGPRVVDFGIARAMDATSTLTSQVIGTPAYMAPEQVAGDPVSPATDIFAWAATMVFAATGCAPFGQDTVPAVFQRVLSQTPDLGGLPAPLRTIVTFCLAKNPADRPTAEQLLHDLLRGPAQPHHLRNPATAAPPVSWRPKRSWWSFIYGVCSALAFLETIAVPFIAEGAEKLVMGSIFLTTTVICIVCVFGHYRYPLNVREAKIEVGDTGITATLDDRMVVWDWGDIKQVTIRPGFNPATLGLGPRVWGLWVIRARATRLERITFWQRFGVLGMGMFSRWSLLLPLGRRGAPGIPKIADALSRYGRERWTPYS